MKGTVIIMKLCKGDTFSVTAQDGIIAGFAESELKKYLEKIGLVHSDRPRYSFEIFCTDSLKNEGFSIEIKKDSVCFSGCGTGIIYSVYEFLEKYLGFCFAAPGGDNTPK